MIEHSSLPWVTKPTWDGKTLPAFKDLPIVNDLPCAWEVWGKGDQLGTVNLLTPEVVAAASKEVKDGQSVSLNLPVQLPSKPAFHRKHPEVNVLANHGPVPVRDDELHINSQSGTQWDGLRHFGVLSGMCFYGGVPEADIKTGELDLSDPLKLNPQDIQLGVHHWAQHGIHGRGVLVDLVSFYTKGGKPLPYDPCTTHGIPLKDIKAAAKEQGVTFQKADILILRVGWTQRYYGSTQEEKDLWGAGKGEEHFAGIENTPEVQEWLWDNHFAAVASDQPAFESWPPAAGETYLHSTIIGNYGSPIGEFFDLEELSIVCAKKKRYTFFFVSNPLMTLGGAASLVNGTALF